MVARGDGFSVRTIGRRKWRFKDIYVNLLSASWQRMTAVVIILYFGVNILFACLYALDPGSVANARPHSFADLFFFSIQSFATIGYGSMLPQGIYGNMLVTIESFFGICFTGLITGLMFTRFSKPKARVLFSDKAVIGQYDGHREFMMRLANQRDNRIVEASVKMTLMRDERTPEGRLVRKFYDLKLERNEIPLLRFTWTLHHRIDESSPLFGMSHKDLETTESEIIIAMTGFDETMSQTIHARNSYIAKEIVCNGAFADILHRQEDYVLEVRYDRFHDIVQLEPEDDEEKEAA